MNKENTNKVNKEAMNTLNHELIEKPADTNKETPKNSNKELRKIDTKYLDSFSEPNDKEKWILELQHKANEIIDFLQPKESKATNQEPTKDWEKEIRRQIKMGGGETLVEAICEQVKSLLKTQREKHENELNHTADFQHKMGRLQAKKAIKRDAAEKVRLMMMEFANTPLDKRKTGWDWLIKIRDKIEKEL